MERYTEDGNFTREGAEASAAEFREFRPDLADSVFVVPQSQGWAVMVRPGWRLCDKCQGTGWVGESKEHACVDSLLGSPDCVHGFIRVELTHLMASPMGGGLDMQPKIKGE